MNLFNKDKEIIFKILNAILLIWFIAATVVMLTTIVRLVVKDPSESYSYDEYRVVYCDYTLDTESEEMKDINCEDAYENYNVSNKSMNYNKLMTIYGAAINIIVVGGVTYLLNKENNKKTPTKGKK